jgi:hypothetical protein
MSVAILGQLAHQQLPLDLEPDREEEHRHQCIVDPVVKVEGDPMIAKKEAERLVQEAEVQLRPRRVGPNQGDERTDEKDDAP